MRDGSVSPHFRAFRVLIDLQGPDAEEAEFLAEQFRTRCPVYTTLNFAATIEITHTGLMTGEEMDDELDSEAEVDAEPEGD